MKRACRPSPCSLAAALLLAGAAAWGQIQITSTPNPVGSGARALGMGGAFIAIADDATAASWNPGGLTQLEEPELSLVYSMIWNEEDFSSSVQRGFNREHDLSWDQINYASFVYPIPRTLAGRNFVLSLNYQREYDFDRDLKVNFRSIFGNGLGNIIDTLQRVDYSQRGSLGAISPAFGFEITDKISVGLVLNLWDQSLISDNEWKTRRTIRARGRVDGALVPGFVRLTVDEDFDDFHGTNYTAGILYKPTERLSFGAVYHSKLVADVEYNSSVKVFPGLPGFITSKRNQQIVFPSAVGLGFAYRFPNDKLTLSADITRREWGQFVIDDPDMPTIFGVPLGNSMKRRSGVTGLPTRFTEVDPTYTIRVGAEYVFVNAKRPKQDYLPSLRGGLFYDPEPSGGRSDSFWGIERKGDGKPDPYYGFAIGGGVLIKNRVNIDAAYTYRFGDNVRKDTFGLAETDADVDQHTFYISTVIYF